VGSPFRTKGAKVSLRVPTYFLGVFFPRVAVATLGEKGPGGTRVAAGKEGRFFPPLKISLGGPLCGERPPLWCGPQKRGGG